MIAKPCLTCGTPGPDTYCPDHQPTRPSGPVKGSTRARGYDQSWRKLSERARKLQPFCSDCGARDDLTCDHLPQAWERKAAGLPLRLQDIDVVCRGCNTARGSSRPGQNHLRPGGMPPTRGRRLRVGRLGGRYIPPGGTDFEGEEAS